MPSRPDIPDRWWKPQPPKLDQDGLTKAVRARDKAFKEAEALTDPEERRRALAAVETMHPLVPGVTVSNVRRVMPQTPTRPELIPIASLPSLYNPRDLALIRRKVAIDTTDDEFSLFTRPANLQTILGRLACFRQRRSGRGEELNHA